MSNHLKNEKSPYLIQHANNPVDWFPWCEDAFIKAHQENKPIFLSIGYSTCHWCHVMAHESFEDEQVARILNENFISIKVDREERPDIDAVYMSVCQALTGSGGWPLTIFMTAEQKPFYAGTYFSKHSAYGRVGLIELLERIVQLWNNQRSDLLKAGNQITHLLCSSADSPAGTPCRELVEQGLDELYRLFDPIWGGFGPAPKFPTPHNLLFLLRYAAVQCDNGALHLAETTLKAMAHGGIFDHIGGGFSRYSTDERWLVPHFEKMLYDNALLAYVYLEAYQQTQNNFYRSVALQTIDYVLRELIDTKEGFYCGQDADSDGVEGKYYVFTPAEIFTVLGEKDGRLFCEQFDITDCGNFEGKSIPNRIGKEWKLNSHLEGLCQKLYRYRLERTQLHCDDKVLTSWNSMMILALAKAALICQDPAYLSAAVHTQQFIERQLSSSAGRLFVRYRDGETAHPGQLGDYAFYALSLIFLYQSTLEVQYLAKAIRTAEWMLGLFSDKEKGGFFLYANDAEQLISRPKETYDGSIPSGNSTAAHVLVLLAALTGEERWRTERDRQLQFLSAAIQTAPAGHCFALSSLLGVLYPSAELICVSAQDQVPSAVWHFLRSNHSPNLTILFKSPKNQKELANLAPFTRGYPIPNSGIIYYLCQGNTCSEPFADLEKLDFLLD